jgi:hypothetical protein
MKMIEGWPFSATNVVYMRGVLDSACQIHTPKGEHFYYLGSVYTRRNVRLTSHCFSGSFGDKNAERLHITPKKMVGRCSRENHSERRKENDWFSTNHLERKGWPIWSFCLALVSSTEKTTMAHSRVRIWMGACAERNASPTSQSVVIVWGMFCMFSTSSHVLFLPRSHWSATVREVNRKWAKTAGRRCFPIGCKFKNRKFRRLHGFSLSLPLLLTHGHSFLLSRSMIDSLRIHINTSNSWWWRGRRQISKYGCQKWIVSDVDDLLSSNFKTMINKKKCYLKCMSTTLMMSSSNTSLLSNHLLTLPFLVLVVDVSFPSNNQSSILPYWNLTRGRLVAPFRRLWRKVLLLTIRILFFDTINHNKINQRIIWTAKKNSQKSMLWKTRQRLIQSQSL